MICYSKCRVANRYNLAETIPKEDMAEQPAGFLQQPKGFATTAIHAGQNPEQWNCNAVVPPIVMSTTFKQDGPADHKGFEYGRSGNPTRTVLETCLAALDGGKYGVCFSSGLGASTVIANLLSAGDHLISGDDIYGGTNRYFREVAKRMGIEVSFIDTTNLQEVSDTIQKNTKMIWIESPTNPLLKVTDIRKVSEIIRQHSGIFLAVDNTFLSSYFQRPLELGADIVMYSLTKYMNGHSDVIMGAAITNSEDLHKRMRFLQNAMGIIPSPFDCYQVNRSLKTLALRMEQHMKNGLIVGKYLENHKNVEKVFHPGMQSHPQYKLTMQQCYGHSGVLSFYLKGGLQESKKFLQALKIFTLAESLGGFESLAELPSMMTHASVPAEQRQQLGISDSLIRLSVGLESSEDLIEDLKQALGAASDE